MHNNAAEAVGDVCSRFICSRKINGIIYFVECLRKIIVLLSFQIHQQHAWPLKKFKLFVTRPCEFAPLICEPVIAEAWLGLEVDLNECVEIV